MASSSTISSGCGEAHDAAPAAARVLDDVPAVASAGARSRVVLVHERADRLGRLRERRVVPVDQHLRDDGGDHGVLQPSRRSSLFSALLDLVADRALRVRDAGVERHLVQLVPRRARSAAG